MSIDQPPSGQPQPCPRCKQPVEGSMAVHYAEHHGEYIPLYLERQGQPKPRNPLRAALERFGRERGRAQSSAVWPSDTTRLYPTEAEEREFREAKEKYGLKDHWPQGQPQSSTAASADEVERRRRANSTAIERGQPQQEPAPLSEEDMESIRQGLRDRAEGRMVKWSEVKSEMEQQAEGNQHEADSPPQAVVTHSDL